MFTRITNPRGRGRRRRSVAVLAAAALSAPALAMAPAAAAPATEPLAPITDSLDEVLAEVPGTESLTVLVHGSDAEAASEAIADAGMAEGHRFERVAVVAATGTAEQVEQLRAQSGVSYLEHNDPMQHFATSGTQATRAAQAQTELLDTDGNPVDGRGSSVAVIDSGIDPMHPAFLDEDGQSRVAANMRAFCPDELGAAFCEVVDAGELDTDTTSVGGHGTHVTGIATGQTYELADGSEVGGSAPGAGVVSVATGTGVLLLSTLTAMEWVLENHEHPCAEEVPAEECPPIKVINNSFGPLDAEGFDEFATAVKLQRELADEGVLTVWANGNSGGDGTENLSNPPAQDPTPGVLGVAAYFDEGTGTREGSVAEFSSRGVADDPQSWPDISAPGEEVLSACRPTLPVCSTGLDPRNGPGALDIGAYNVISGTSMAAPQVAGIVAQLFQVAPDASPAEIENALKATAHKYADGQPYTQDGDFTSSFDKGTGLVDAAAAIERLGEVEPAGVGAAGAP